MSCPVNLILRRVAPAVLVLAAVLIAGAPARSATFEDPDWPCIQRKVPEISLAQMWAGPQPGADADAAVEGLAQRLAQRRSGLDAVEAEAAAWASGLDPADRPQRLAQLFAAILDHVNRERAAIIEGIGRYAHKQEQLARRVEDRQSELVALRAAPEPDLDRVEELQDRLAWDIRVFRERAQSLTYVCETPVLLESRAFSIARLLAGMI